MNINTKVEQNTARYLDILVTTTNVSTYKEKKLIFFKLQYTSAPFVRCGETDITF
jgi:hypothetical protein